MRRLILIFILLYFQNLNAQEKTLFTDNLNQFSKLSDWKKTLKDVEIIALGENTHGLGDVFSTKVELVKFLHEELGFDLVLFESGYGDAAIAKEKMNELDPYDYTLSFSSNLYYQSQELKSLSEYAFKNKTLTIGGFDCQPQQVFFIQQLSSFLQPIDSAFANSVQLGFEMFNVLYTFEYNKDTAGFIAQQKKFCDLLNQCDSILIECEKEQNPESKNQIAIFRKTISIFKSTYSDLEFGGLMKWPEAYNLRDKAMFDVVKWYKDSNPDSKIIIWAQNSHIENVPKPNYTVKWMGHYLKETYGDKYYSVGAIVYSGDNLNYNGPVKFEHSLKDFLAYHLNKSNQKKFIFDLRHYEKQDFTNELLKGMESNGNIAEFYAKQRFDGLLFLHYSDIPKLLPKR